MPDASPLPVITIILIEDDFTGFEKLTFHPFYYFFPRPQIVTGHR